MKVLITGANGFLGKNLIEKLVKMEDVDIYHYEKNGSRLLLDRNLAECDFLFHLAAVHRPTQNSEFYKINDEFFSEILDVMESNHNNCPVLLTSSIQATDNNDYGRSKLLAEKRLRRHSQETGARAIIYRLSNTFGKWAVPNRQSVVATFCYNINRDIPITISNRDIVMHFHYVDDVVDSFAKQLRDNIQPDADGIMRLPESQIYEVTLGELADTLYYFRKCQKENQLPLFKSKFTKRLYATYMSYATEA